MLSRIMCIAALLTLAGCASLDEGYNTRFGLMSTENPQGRGNPAEESYGGGVVGIREIEEYEDKYRKRNVLGPQETVSPSESTGR